MDSSVCTGFHAIWSAEDQEFVATTDTAPSLSWLAPGPVEALAGLIAMLDGDPMPTDPEGTREDRQEPRDSDRRKEAAGSGNPEGVPKPE